MATVSQYFYTSLVNFFLPFEAKYVSLRKNKDFILIQELIEFYVNYIIPNKDNEISKENFLKNYWSKFEKKESVKKAYVEYIALLIETFDIPDERIRELNDLIDKNKNNPSIFAIVISDIENYLNISNKLVSQKQLLIKSKITHINSDLYKVEMDEISSLLSDFLTLYNCMIKIHQKKEIDYLLKIVINEMLNFLSHYAMGIAFFNSPTNFISNLQKARSHLKRVILDILDNLILEADLVELDYLKIRLLKVASLGKTKDIFNTIEEMKSFFWNKDVCSKLLS